MSILKHFSDDEKARYAYERRMMLLSLQTTIDNENRDNKALAEAAQQQAEAAQQQAEAAQQQAEAAQQQAEAAQQQAQEAQARAEQEAAARTLLELRLLASQQQQAQTLRQHLRVLYVQRFDAPLPLPMTAALADATLEQLTAWLSAFISASATDLLALTCPAP
jgi:flagellar biosynthesis GTPase FlhF